MRMDEILEASELTSSALLYWWYQSGFDIRPHRLFLTDLWLYKEYNKQGLNYSEFWSIVNGEKCVVQP